MKITELSFAVSCFVFIFTRIVGTEEIQRRFSHIALEFQVRTRSRLKDFEVGKSIKCAVTRCKTKVSKPDIPTLKDVNEVFIRSC